MRKFSLLAAGLLAIAVSTGGVALAGSAVRIPVGDPGNRSETCIPVPPFIGYACVDDEGARVDAGAVSAQATVSRDGVVDLTIHYGVRIGPVYGQVTSSNEHGLVLCEEGTADLYPQGAGAIGSHAVCAGSDGDSVRTSATVVAGPCVIDRCILLGVGVTADKGISGGGHAEVCVALAGCMSQEIP